MNLHPTLLSLLVLLTASLPFGGQTRADDSGVDSEPNATQYFVELAEYKLEQSIPTGLAEDEVIASILKSGTKPVETIRLTAMSETESMVQIGRRVALTTGTMTRSGVTTRQTQEMEIGTMLRLKIKEHTKGAIADIDYTTSRLDGDGANDTPPDVVTNTIQSTQFYGLGKTRLLSTVGASKLTGVLVTVHELP
ncbi:secreted protein [Rhodopirellula maiorica SM1]|uniref:Secreted protein n=1 Tax=Rhodopirellula maiorica SM1 TaxID=1265738 RepID=M5RQL7_9BACT|nr:hypothetical protein [Rhodopirellula maiorica]EMI21506.1 secreted protein [Rhodopirellula maiorica SM1]